MRRVLASLAVVSFAVTAAVADEVFVGSPLGPIMHAELGGEVQFQFSAACGGPIRSMALSGRTLMIGDTNGNVYGLDLDNENGGAGYYFTIEDSDNTGVIAHDGTLLFSSLDGTVRRVNATNGAVVATYTSPIEVQAMTRDEQYMYVAGPAGNVYRAELGVGTFSYFACACLGPVNSLAIVGDEVLAGDQWGTVMRFDRENGNITGAFGLPGDNTAMAVTSAGDLMVTDSDGNVRRADAETGEVFETFVIGLALSAVVVVQEETPVPCRGDFDGDGVVTSADFFGFVSAFLRPALSSNNQADFNADGAVDSRDFFEFMAAYFEVCA